MNFRGINDYSLRQLFKGIIRIYGEQHWWQAESPLQVIEGAILTQNTSWKNVERALINLKGLSSRDLLKMSPGDLQSLIRPAGFFKNKEKSLRSLLSYFDGTLESGSIPLNLRDELLELRGVGKETADSIALYAFNSLTFPVDSYTIRFLNRFFGANLTMNDYEHLRSLFMRCFQKSELMEIHGLIDEHSKRICRKVPDCSSCQLRTDCMYFNG